MKHTYLVFIFVIFSSIAYAAEVKKPFCKGQKQILEELKSSDAFNRYHSFVVENGFPLKSELCAENEIVDIVVLFNESKGDRYSFDPNRSTFYETPYGKMLIESYQKLAEEPFERAYFISPFELNSFLNYQQKQSKTNFKNTKSALSKFHDYQAKEWVKRNEEEIKKKKESAAREAEKRQIEGAALKTVTTYLESNKSIRYILSIAEKGKNILNEKEAFIKNKMAEDEEDFYKRIVLACFKMECDERLKTEFIKNIKGNLNFKINNVSPVYYLIKYNRLEELKQTIKNIPDYYFSKEEMSLSAHLYDQKIYDWIVFNNSNSGNNNFEREDLILDNDVVLSEMPMSNMAKILIEKNKTQGYFYSDYFMSKNRKFKVKDILGVASKVSGLKKYVEQDYKEAAKKINLPLVNFNTFSFYAYEKPSWNSNKVLVELDSVETLEPVNATKDQKKNLPTYSFGYEDEVPSYMFLEFDKYWLGFDISGKTYWMHISNFEDPDFMNLMVGRGLIGELAAEEIFLEPKGKMLSSENLKKIVREGLSVINGKWVDGELWLKINTEYAPCGGDTKLEGKDFSIGQGVWIKAFNKDKNLNFSEYPRGC